MGREGGRWGKRGRGRRNGWKEEKERGRQETGAKWRREGGPAPAAKAKATQSETRQEKTDRQTGEGQRDRDTRTCARRSRGRREGGGLSARGAGCGGGKHRPAQASEAAGRPLHTAGFWPPRPPSCRWPEGTRLRPPAWPGCWKGPAGPRAQGERGTSALPGVGRGGRGHPWAHGTPVPLPRTRGTEAGRGAGSRQEAVEACFRQERESSREGACGGPMLPRPVEG